jgi:hypothetical protein
MHSTSHYSTTKSLSLASLAVARLRLSIMYIPQLPCSTEPVLAGWRLLHLTHNGNSVLRCNWIIQSVVRSVKLLPASPAQSFLASVSSRSMTKIYVLCWTCTCLEMGPPLWRGKGSVFLCSCCLLHRSFSTSISALSRRPAHYELCASFVTALY